MGRWWIPQHCQSTSGCQNSKVIALALWPLMSSPVVTALSSTSTQNIHADYTHIKHKSNKTNKPAIAINICEYIYACVHWYDVMRVRLRRRQMIPLLQRSISACHPTLPDVVLCKLYSTLSRVQINVYTYGLYIVPPGLPKSTKVTPNCCEKWRTQEEKKQSFIHTPGP